MTLLALAVHILVGAMLICSMKSSPKKDHAKDEQIKQMKLK